MCQFCLRLLALGFGLSLASAASAQPGAPGGQPPDPEMLFKQLDRNGDGQLTANELPNFNILPPPIRAVLNSADKNGDGAISRDEFIGSFPGRPNGPPGGNGPPNGNGPPGINGLPGAGRTGGPGGNLPAEPPLPIKTAEMDKIFRRLDENRDGKLTTDEVPAEHRDQIDKLMAEADKNKDGSLSKLEFREGLKQLPELGTQLAESDSKFMFQLMDVNHDGRLTSDEIPPSLRSLFEKLLAAGDKDGDGTLSKREFNKAAAQTQPKAAATPKPAPKKKAPAEADAPAQSSR
jgi:Ca2+-binding EF-hand superfamily protein